MFTYSDYVESAAVLREKLSEFEPDVLIILGSGLGSLGENVQNPIFIDYGEIPRMRTSTAIGHKGRFIAGLLGGKRVLLMQGRLHIYEGWSAEEVVFPVRLAKLIGIDKMIITNAAGGINRDFKVGELMLISDFIKFNCVNPLAGRNIDEFGPRFPDMSHAYDVRLQKLTRDVAAKLGIALREGVYCWMNGPTYESPAEIRMARILGGDAVGMSTVPETIVARHSGMDVLGLSCITNMAAGILDQPLSHQEVMETGERVKDTFRALVDGVIAAL